METNRLPSENIKLSGCNANDAKLPPASTALEDPRTRHLDPVLARLVLAGRISADAAVRATTTAQEQRQSLAAAVTSLGLITSRDWAEAVARHYDFELVAADDLPREPLLADLVSPRFLKHTAVLPVRATDDTVWLAMADPGNSYAVKAVGLAVRRRVVPMIVALEDLQKAYSRYWDAGQSALQRIVDDIGEDLTGELSADVEHLIGAAQEAPVVRLVNQLLTDALRLHASDIHIEPSRDRLRVRYRVHGRLREVGAPPARLSAAVISRIKILAKLDIAERRLPQDGRARLTLVGRRIDLRVATDTVGPRREPGHPHPGPDCTGRRLPPTSAWGPTSSPSCATRWPRRTA